MFSWGKELPSRCVECRASAFLASGQPFRAKACVVCAAATVGPSFEFSWTFVLVWFARSLFWRVAKLGNGVLVCNLNDLVSCWSGGTVVSVA